VRKLLLISDLHLGSHLKRKSRGEYVHLAERIEEVFPSFLAHYRARGGWDLVINGDFIDFWNMEVGEARGRRDPEQVAVERLHAVFDAYPAVEEALVRFLEAGNGVVFVTGNHDAELLYPRVRGALASRLEGALGCDESAVIRTGITRVQDVRPGRVRFVPWFLLEEGGVWIEHGHLFDAACSTDAALSPTRHGRLVKSIAEVATRSFSNLMPEIDYDAPDRWGAIDYARWATARGLRFVLRVVFLYLRMIGRMLALWARAGRVDRAGRRRHEDRLQRIAANSGLQMSTLTALEAMAPPPDSVSVGGLLSVSALDILLGAAVPLLLLPAIATATNLPIVPAIAVGAVGSALVAWRLAGRKRRRDVAGDMLDVAARVGATTGVPLVLMGHSHHGTLERRGSVVYGNSGSWLDGSHMVALRDGAGRISDVELRRWRNGGVVRHVQMAVVAPERAAGEPASALAARARLTPPEPG
jgi:UDP-2,3-diacylglucosamine pyrophosphatase LpxH